MSVPFCPGAWIFIICNWTLIHENTGWGFYCICTINSLTKCWWTEPCKDRSNFHNNLWIVNILKVLRFLKKLKHWHLCSLSVAYKVSKLIFLCALFSLKKTFRKRALDSVQYVVLLYISATVHTMHIKCFSCASWWAVGSQGVWRTPGEWLDGLSDRICSQLT